jgi:hypothetical protein
MVYSYQGHSPFHDAYYFTDSLGVAGNIGWHVTYQKVTALPYLLSLSGVYEKSK